MSIAHKKQIFIAFVSFFICVSLDAISKSKRRIVKKNTVSIIIPCSPKHVGHLESLLYVLEKQTTLPDEVVISLSGKNEVLPCVLKNLQDKSWQFLVKIISSEKKQSAGENRNIACKHAVGDIFILQDADDIPHPQRVEIIKKCFENYKINLLLHQYYLSTAVHSNIDFVKIDHIKKILIDTPECFPSLKICNLQLHHGNIAISRKVFDKIKWSKKFEVGEDVEFNGKVYLKYKKFLAVKHPLLYYRQHLSSFTS